MSGNQRLAGERDLKVGNGICECDHGLVWHDTPDLRCAFRYSGPPLCDCPRFAETGWSAEKQPRPKSDIARSRLRSEALRSRSRSFRNADYEAGYQAGYHAGLRRMAQKVAPHG
jgi:hypothetical protein